MKPRTNKKDRSQKTTDRKISYQKEGNPQDYETMSQWQNRHGKGRQKGGSDGGNDEQSNNH